MRRVSFCLIVVLAVLLSSCSSGRVRYPSADTSLQLSRVVLYRNGVGYFERQGRVDGDMLRLKVRKDHVNDLLKSLTVVEREGGKAVSVSMPLDPQTWANAALATLAPGRGSLAQVLDALRGTRVRLATDATSVSGRIMMVERIDVPAAPAKRGTPAKPPSEDHKVTVLDDDEMKVVLLSKVETITLQDEDLAMQFHRSLDATAGEGMFQQVDVSIRLAGTSSHDLLVSYVSPAPMWKPTYRVVLPDEGKGKALLQGWAVVDNVSGEDWRSVRLALTSGAPIAFRYDLHTPRDVERTDLTESGVRKRARVAVGETTYEPDTEREPMPVSAVRDAEAREESWDEDNKEGESSGVGGLGLQGAGKGGGGAATGAPPPAKPKRSAARLRDRTTGTEQPPPPPAVDFASLQRSTQASARATAVSGLTRFDLTDDVTVPDGSSTMVAIVNQAVEAEETFMFKPGGAGKGYEANPYRVVRFRNATPFVLEPGPIAIYAGGSFVGEGLSETVGTGTSATIPFAVEPGIMVTSSKKRTGDQMRLLSIVRGVLKVESFARTTTTWEVRSQTKKEGFTVLVRHPKAGWSYDLLERPQGTEDLHGAYLIPVTVPKGKREADLKVVEQTPSKMELSVWDSRSEELLETFLVSGDLTPAARAKLEPIVKRRQEIGRIDTEIDGLRRQRKELDQRASETRRSLQAIKKDPAAGALRRKLNKRLDEFTSEADRAGRRIVELQSERLEKKIDLEDLLQDFELHPSGAKQ